jgi:anaerobic ribonucleoside-triphosphate reductase
MITAVIKRDGSKVSFDINKIKNAITKAFDGVGKPANEDIINLIALRASSELNDGEVNIEDIQDSVEIALSSSGYSDVAKAYILYRKQHENVRKVQENMLNYKKTVDGYLKADDWRVKENSTVNYSLGGLILSNSGAITANYWLSQIYDEEIGSAHRNSDLHIHDLSMLSGYCFTGDTKIKTLDGKNYSFKELVDNNIAQLWVYSYDSKEGEIVPALAINPRKTRTVNELIKVTLTDGSEILSTLDHPYMLRDGSYVKAKDLKPNTSLMPLDGALFKYAPRPASAESYYNHCVRSIKKIDLTIPVDVYDLTVPKYENFALDAGVFVHNCAGWSLKQLIKEGLGGVEGKICSAPAKHLSTLCNQMVNFLGIMQNEWAGAQAFSSFDTYLSAFVKAENLDYKQVKQCIESFIFGVNTPSRWGCVPETYKVMTTEGWKGIDELKKGDILYTWRDGKLATAVNKNVIIKDHNGKLISFTNDHYGYEQTVTDYHRTLVCKSNEKPENAIIMQAGDIKKEGCATWRMPTAFVGSEIEKGIDLADDEIRLAAMIYTDGSIDSRNDSVHKITYTKSLKRFPKTGTCDVFENLELANNPTTYVSDLTQKTMLKWTFYGLDMRYICDIIGSSKKRIDEKFMHMNPRQAKIFLDTWMNHDGDRAKAKFQCDNDEIRAQLAFIAVLAGRCTSWQDEGGKVKTKYVKMNQVDAVTYDVSEVDYKGRVWCPNNDDGTAIFMNDKGGVFISGQCQAPFTNITLDWTVPPDLKELPAIVGGKEMEFTYGDCQKEMDMVNKAFLEIMLHGDADGRGFQYPIPTYSLTKDFDWSATENNKLLFAITARYGTPYFSNYIGNTEMQPSDVRSMCCRLRLDLRELRKKSGGFFGSGESTGSVGVVTLNMPRLAYLATSEKNFYERLDRLMDIAARSLKIKRNAITQFLENGLYPYTKRYLGTFNNHFSTIGLVGMNEACLNAKWLKCDLTHEEAQKFTGEVLDHMREKLSDYQELYGDLYNLEATPAESTAYRLAMHDKKRYPNIITAGSEETPYYTNSSNLPVGFTEDLFQAMDIQNDLQVKYTSGTVFHVFLGESPNGWESTANLVRKIAENYKLPYFTISPTYSVCMDHGYIVGEHYTCPTCGKKTEVYSRITGYYRPVANWNDGKKAEFSDRAEYTPLENCSVDGKEVSSKEELPSEKAEENNAKRILITTKTCPNCIAVKKQLASAGIEYEIVDAEENADFCKAHSINSVPTFIVGDTIMTGIGVIVQWIRAHK